MSCRFFSTNPRMRREKNFDNAPSQPASPHLRTKENRNKLYVGGMRIAFPAVALLISSVPAVCADARPWEIFEVEMTARDEYPNAYIEGLPDQGKSLVRVTFTGPNGEAFAVSGFWDGGKTWRARFAPPASGQWSYVSTSSDPGLSGSRGSFTCTRWS